MKIITKIYVVLFCVITFFNTSVSAAENFVTGTGTYTMSDYETLTVAEERALDNAKLNVSEKIGILVDSYIKTKNTYLDTDMVKLINNYSYDIIDKRAEYENISNDEIKITVYIKVEFNSNIADKILLEGEQKLKSIMSQEKEIEQDILEQNNKVREYKKKISELKNTALSEDIKHEVEVCEREYLALKELSYGNRAILAGFVDLCIEHYTKAININPKLDRAYVSRAGALTDRKQEHDRAIDDLNKAILLNPHNATAYVYRAFAYGKKNMEQEMLSDLNKALELDKNDSQALTNRGWYYEEHGMIDLAEKDYTRAIESYSKNIIAYLNRARLYARQNKYQLALNDFTIVINNSDVAKREMGGDYKSSALHDRAYVYNQLGDFDAAMRDFTNSIQYNPNDLFSYCDRGFLYIERGEISLAEEDFYNAIRLCDKFYAIPYKSKQEIIEVRDKQSLSYKGLSDVYQVKKNYNKAIECLDKAIAIKPTRDLLDYLYAGRAVYKILLGNVADASQDLKMALELNPNNEEAKRIYNDIQSKNN